MGMSILTKNLISFHSVVLLFFFFNQTQQSHRKWWFLVGFPPFPQTVSEVELWWYHQEPHVLHCWWIMK